MKLSLTLNALVALVSLAEAAPALPALEGRALPLVQSVSDIQRINASRQLTLKSQNQLRRVLLRSELLAKGQILQDFAYSWEGRNRLIGTPGHNKTVNYLYDTLVATGYYDVAFQEFVIASPENETVIIAGQSIETAAMSFSQAGDFTAPLAKVANLGCDAVSTCICECYRLLTHKYRPTTQI